MKIFYTPEKSQSLYHLATGLLGLPINDSTTLSRAEFVMLANVWLRNTNEWVWKASNYWRYDDTNNTDLPEAEADLVDGQEDYTLETTVNDIEQVKILDVNGNEIVLEPKSLEEAERLTYGISEGLPTYYSLVGNVLRLKPAPSSDHTTLTDGIIITLSRDISEFSITDTNKEPGIPSQFHPIIAYGVARDKSIPYGLVNTFAAMDKLIRETRVEIEGHFNKRFRNMKKRIIPNVSSSI